MPLYSDETAIALRMTDLCVNVSDLLDRAALAGAAVSGSDDASVRALTEFLDELVLRIDDEGRVECGELVSLHGSCVLSK